MRGRIKGPDSSIYSILRTVGIYRTSGEFIEPEAVWKRIPMPSLTIFRATNQLKHLRSCSTEIVELGAWSRSTIPVLHSRWCFN